MPAPPAPGPGRAKIIASYIGEGPGARLPALCSSGALGYMVLTRPDAAYRPISADEFLVMDFGSDRRFELVRGVIQMTSGGSSDHARVAGNIYFFLRLKLRGSTCRPFGSDMAIRVDSTNVRYPNVSVVCGADAWSDKRGAALAFDDPVILFEVLAATTTAFDQGTKLEEYRHLATLNTVVFVDPMNELTRTFQWFSAEGWHDTTFAKPHDVILPALGLTLTHQEIFARD